MKDVSFVLQLGVVIMAALLGGVLARLIKLPVIVGFLIAGIAIGPHTPGLIADTASVQRVASVGIALLMFAVGVQFSLKELTAIRKTAVIAGTLQISGCIGLGVLLSAVFGWGLIPGLLLGGALSMSSTAVMLKILEERGELGSTHGAIMLGILVLQDLSLILMVSLLPVAQTIETHGPNALISTGIGLLRGALAISVVLFLATKLIPKFLDRITRLGSPELFLLTIVVLCLGAAVLADQVGLGMALGAFLAGIVVSESSYAHEIFSQVRPLRDVFSSIFFVSIGMLLDPTFLFQNWLPVTMVLLAIIVGKALLVIVGLLWTGWHLRTAITVGLGLAQIGEFSFVLIMEGASKKLVNEHLSGIVVSAALISILLAPFIYLGSRRVYFWLSRVKGFRRFVLKGKTAHSHGDSRTFRPRVIVLGGGRVGRYTSEALRRNSVPHVVVDYDSIAIQLAENHNIPTLYGDATSPDVLEQTHPDRAELAVVALPDATTTEMAVKAIKKLAPELPVIARVRRGLDIPRMRAAGADTVVHGEFEAGVETIRCSLIQLGMPEKQIDDYVEEARRRRYRHQD